MKQLLFPLILLWTAVGCSPTRPESTPPSQSPAKHVIFIGVDGLSPDGIRQAKTPAIDEMIDQGASSMQARSVFMTSSSPNWAAMINGVGPEQSGITTNAWGRDNYILPATHLGVEAVPPTIFSIIRDQLPESKIACIYHWTGLGRLLEKTVMDYHRTWDTETETTADAVRYIEEERPTFLFIHLDHVDGVGHASGHGTAPYYASIEWADSLIGNIVQASRDAKIFEETVFILTSDHGGINKGHGGETAEETEIPFVVYGKGVKDAFPISQTVNQYDSPSTALYALGLDQPDMWIGRPVKVAFEGNDEGYRGYRRLAAIPQVHPDAGAFLSQIPPVSLSTLTEFGEIRYTLDGSEPDVKSPIYSEPISLTQSTTLKAKTFKGDQVSESRIAHYTLIEENQGHGVVVSYWPRNQVRRFGQKSDDPTVVDTVYQLDLGGLSIIKGDVRYAYQTWLEIEEAGDYRFELVSDNPASLKIGGTSRETRGHYMSGKKELSLFLEQSRHPITLDYQPDAYGRSLQLYYEGPGIERQKIPADRLYLRKE